MGVGKGSKHCKEDKGQAAKETLGKTTMGAVVLSCDPLQVFNVEPFEPRLPSMVRSYPNRKSTSCTYYYSGKKFEEQSRGNFSMEKLVQKAKRPLRGLEARSAFYAE